MTPEERLITLIKEEITDGSSCCLEGGCCFYYAETNNDVRCCFLFPRWEAGQLRLNEEGRPIRSNECIELKPIKEKT